MSLKKMVCCRYVKAYLGFTQHGEWYVVMASNDKIECECHPYTEFVLKPPFSVETWKHHWKECETKFLKNKTDVCIKWETEIEGLLSVKAFQKNFGKIVQKS